MGRPGAGGGFSGGGFSSGHSFGSRSSSGHSIGGGRPGSVSSRPGTGRSYSSGSSSRNYSSGSGRRYYGSSYGGGYNRGYYDGYNSGRRRRHYRSSSSNGGGLLINTIAWLVVIAAVFMVFTSYTGVGLLNRVPKSTVNREKLDNPYGYVSDCITDELDWFNNETRTEKELQKYYKKTGVQPYILIKGYSSEYASMSEAELEDYARDVLFDEYAPNEYTYMYVYYEVANPSEVGYMVGVGGSQTGTVMDTESVDIFWSYLEKEWVSDKSADEMFVDVFESTGKRIMTTTTTAADVALYGVIGATAVGAVFGGLAIKKQKDKRDKEKAEETERILNTPLETLADSELNNLQKKYDQMGSASSGSSSGGTVSGGH